MLDLTGVSLSELREIRTSSLILAIREVFERSKYVDANKIQIQIEADE